MSKQQVGVRQKAVLDVGELLRACWPQHTAKHAARLAEISPRSVEDWIAHRREPSTRTLWNMAANSAVLRAQLIKSLAALDRANSETLPDVEMARTCAAVARRQAA